MKYIFLDIDGVLNSTSWMEYCYETRSSNGNWRLDSHFDERCYKLLGKVCKKNKALVILTSSWRSGFANQTKSDELIDKANELFSKYHICIHGWTSLDYTSRGDQIANYILTHLKGNDDFVIIDDETCDIDGKIADKYICKINYRIGLQKSDVKKINKILKGV